MKKYIFLLVFSIASCTSCRSKERYLFTVNMCKYAPNKCTCNLFSETFSAFDQGAWGTGLDSDYLTDSVNFRIYLGTYDEEDEMIVVKCNGGDSIYVEKKVRIGPRRKGASFRTEEKTGFSIEDLKRKHVFE
jgi:hypothetical protein